MLGTVLGPAAGTFSDLAAIAAAITKEEMNKVAAKAVIRQVPGASLPGVRTLMNTVIKPAVGVQ